MRNWCWLLTNAFTSYMKIFRRFFALFSCYQFSSVQSFSHIWLFVTPWTAAREASFSITNSWSPPKLMSIESVMPSNRLILCHLLLLLPSIFPSIRVLSNESALRIRWLKYWSCSFKGLSISSWISYKNLYLERNFSISSELNLLA